MKASLILGVILATLPGLFAEDLPPSHFFHGGEISCARLAMVANHYINLGEEKTVAEFRAVAKDIDRTWNDHLEAGRFAWICRLLFQDPEAPPLREAAIGSLSLPHLSMPLKDWPFYPLAESQGAYFVMSQGYEIAGVPESAGGYLDYCLEHGHFRRVFLKVPSQKQAAAALNSLLHSQPWKQIEWSAETAHESYGYDENRVIRFLQSQTGMKLPAREDCEDVVQP